MKSLLGLDPIVARKNAHKKGKKRQVENLKLTTDVGAVFFSGKKMGEVHHRQAIITGLSDVTTSSSLRRALSSFGEVTETAVTVVPPHSMRRNFAYVLFENKESLGRAIKQRFIDVDDARLEIKSRCVGEIGTVTRNN
jgi:hypothetical protein